MLIAKAVKAKQYSSEIAKSGYFVAILVCRINFDFLIFKFDHIVLLIISFMRVRYF